jgi:hypothetical protein
MLYHRNRVGKRRTHWGISYARNTSPVSIYPSSYLLVTSTFDATILEAAAVESLAFFSCSFSRASDLTVICGLRGTLLVGNAVMVVFAWSHDSWQRSRVLIAHAMFEMELEGLEYQFSQQRNFRCY